MSRRKNMVEIGDDVGGYVLAERLGEGGFGAVYAAHHAVTGREVAIKVLHPRFCEEIPLHGPSAIDRFLQEARILQSLRTIGIVEVTGIIEDRTRGVIAYVMERLRGMVLSEVVPQIALTELLAVFARVALTLGELHEKGILHRDIKLDNVFLCDPVRPGAPRYAKLIDLGTARCADGEVVIDRTAVGMFVGSVEAMAPEYFQRLVGENVELTAAVDQWGLGVALYQALSGTLPFSSGQLIELIAHVQFMQTPRLQLRSQYGLSDTPPGIRAAIERCLEKDPKGRFPHMRALADQLLAEADRLGASPVDLESIPHILDQIGPDPLLAARPALGADPVYRPKSIPPAPYVFATESPKPTARSPGAIAAQTELGVAPWVLWLLVAEAVAIVAAVGAWLEFVA